MEQQFQKVIFTIIYTKTCIFMGLNKIVIKRDNFVHENHSFPGKKGNLIFKSMKLRQLNVTFLTSKTCQSLSKM